MSTLKLRLSKQQQIPQDLDLGVKMTRKTKSTVVAPEDCCFPCFEDFIADGDLTRLVEDPVAPQRAIFNWPEASVSWSGTISVVGYLCDYEGEFNALWVPPLDFAGSPPTFTYGTDDVGPTITISGSSEHDGGSIAVWLTVTHPEQDCSFAMGPPIFLSGTVVISPVEWLMAEEAQIDITYTNMIVDFACDVAWSGSSYVVVSPLPSEVDFTFFSWGVGSFDPSIWNVTEDFDGEGRPRLTISSARDPGTDPGQLCEVSPTTLSVTPTMDWDGAGPDAPVSVGLDSTWTRGLP